MNILLVQTGFIGDAILSTPLIANLKKEYPAAKIYTLSTPVSAGVFKYNPIIADALVYDKKGVDRGLGGFFRILKLIKSKEFDLVFSLHKSYRTSLLLWLSRIKKRYGFKRASFSFLYSKRAKRADLKHEVLRNLALLRVLGYEPRDLEQKLSIPLPESAILEAEELLKPVTEKGVVGIAPGSVWATKRWTTNGFSEVTRALTREGYQVVLIGGPQDLQIAKEVEKSADVEVLNLVGKTDLITSAGVISRLMLLITNDSAPLHLASSVGTPVVSLFCATVPEFGFGPWQVDNEIVEVKGLDCRPCGSHGGKSCPTGTHACQLEIQSAQVLAAVSRLAKRVSRGTVNE